MTQTKTPAAKTVKAKAPAPTAATKTPAAKTVKASPVIAKDPAPAAKPAAIEAAAADRAAQQLAELGLAPGQGLGPPPPVPPTRLDAKKPPEKVTLAAPYAFYEDDGTFRTWPAGHEVTDRHEIVELIARRAPLLED